ncbi:hypothetical protein BSKO_05295 [Bryopsis sp. KO-2023]|nr:hypothetical protein BSKO_05295 [Bryopsis sp. KO-2023]
MESIARRTRSATALRTPPPPTASPANEGEGWNLCVLWYGRKEMVFPFDAHTSGLSLKEAIAKEWDGPTDEVVVWNLEDWVENLHVDAAMPCALSDGNLTNQGISDRCTVLAVKASTAEESRALAQPDNPGVCTAVTTIPSSDPEVDVLANPPSMVTPIPSRQKPGLAQPSRRLPETMAATPTPSVIEDGSDREEGGTVRSQRTSQTSVRRKWSDEETWALLEGVERHGIGRWGAIQGDYELRPLLENRNYVQLKDRWTNLIKTATKPTRKARGSEKFLPRVIQIYEDFFGLGAAGSTEDLI